MIYLDFNATTPVDRRVLQAMLPAFEVDFGNASSIDHAAGAAARELVETARSHVAQLVGAQPEEIVFTSGATESDNIAVLGTMAKAEDDAELITSAIEHPAVLGPARTVARRLRIAPVDGSGVVDPDSVRRLLTSKTALVSVMAANNETGAVQPVAEIGRMCAEAGVPFHVDAVQSVARLRIDVKNSAIAMASLSAHKMYGPKGVGALYVRRGRPRVRVSPVMFGGGQERSLRPGTLNVPGIVGMGEAARLVRVERSADHARESALRSEMLDALRAHAACDVIENIPTSVSLPQTLSVRVPGVRAAAVLRRLAHDVAVSSGSACATTSVEPSHVLLAQGLSAEQAGETLRVSFGRQTSRADAMDGAQLIGEAVAAVNDSRAHAVTIG
jgi:cysteine desulfurase